MTEDTPRRQRKPSGPQSDAEGTEAPAAPETPDEAATGAQGPATGPAEAAAAKLREAEHHLASIQVSAPNPELSRVRTLIQHALKELAGHDGNGADA